MNRLITDDGQISTAEPALGHAIAPQYAGAAVIAAGVAALMVADLAAPAPFVPEQIRAALLAAVIITLVITLDRRREIQAERRHQEVMEAMRSQARGYEYIRGYVDGIERRPPAEAQVDAG